MSDDLIDRLRAWARRYDPRSPERTLFLAAAQELEKRPVVTEITADAVEARMGGKLLPWQRERLDTPPSSEAA